MTCDAAAARFDERFLVLAPTGRDAALTAALLAKAGVQCDSCTCLTEMIRRAEQEGCAGLLIADEVLDPTALAALARMIDRQEAWSDIPILLFTGEGATIHARTPTARLLAPLGNVTLLDRPLRPITMITATRSALRARHRQYQARSEIVEQQHAVRQRDQFLAMLGHELRNPLGAITMAVELMDQPGAKVTRYHNIVRHQTQNLTRLVDDLLDVSRVTSGKIVLQRSRLDFGALIYRCIQSMDTTIKAQHLHVTFARPPEGPMVDADQVRLEQVVVNLVTNAIKYTPAGGNIAVSTDVEGDDVVLQVGDSGVGIAADMIDRVFDLFAQVEGTLDRAKGGMGIGLTLVRSLVELHGGSVKASSAGANRGSVFTVRLPRASVESTVACEPAVNGRRVAGRDVLIVEDNPDIRDLLQQLLESYGHHVDSVGDGLTAVEHARRHRPSIIVVDIGLPGLDGYGVAERVRQSLGSSVYLVALTGYGRPDDRRRALEAGFDVHMTKPVDVDALRHMIAAHAAS
jgi:signal transduction histidine kinase